MCPFGEFREKYKGFIPPLGKLDFFPPIGKNEYGDLVSNFELPFSSELWWILRGSDYGNASSWYFFHRGEKKIMKVDAREKKKENKMFGVQI